MSKKLPHLLFKNPSNGFKGFKYAVRNNSNDKEEKPQEYYMPKAIDFTNSLGNLESHLETRIDERNVDLNVTEHIKYIEVNFHGSFDEDSFGNSYKNKFGLSGIKYDNFNSKVIFAIVDDAAFANFIKQIQLYLVEENHNDPKYAVIIRYIENFDLLTTSEMMSRYNGDSSIHFIDLVNELAIFKYEVIKAELIGYLNINTIDYYWDDLKQILEIKDIPKDIILEICNNYDIILSVNSSSTVKVTPGQFGQLERDYPFEINVEDDIPTIGIIDTGISNTTPLKDLLVNTNNDYDRFNFNPLLDNVGHGTSVGAFAALGKTVAEDPNGLINADAKLLSIKVLDETSGSLPISTVEHFITMANLEHGIRIFVLTINFEIPKKTNEDFSTYAYTIDKLAYDLDVLIFISTGNYQIDFQQADLNNYPNNFLNQDYNLQTPAESINNLTIGSIGDNFRNPIVSITDKNHPTIYTRTYHLDFENASRHKVFKPDLVYSGGNYESDEYGIYSGGSSSLQILSQTYSYNGSIEFFEKAVGTSLSTPLVANLAAKLMRLYPELNSQSYKSLLINSTKNYSQYGFTGYPESQVKYIVGNGIPREDNLLYSSENNIMMVLEDKIHPGDTKTGMVKYYRIEVPKYLNTHPNNQALLEINITLCYKSSPIKDNHIGYNPIHMAFNLFKNLTNDELNDALAANSKFNDILLVKSSNNWSQDAYYKSRILNNSQKVRYTVSKELIKANNNVIVLGINCMYHKMVRKSIHNEPNYNKEHDFSIAISIRENAAQSKLTGKLYNEIINVNNLENINDIELDLDA